MWAPQHFTTLWAFTACYRDSFIIHLQLAVLFMVVKITMQNISAVTQTQPQSVEIPHSAEIICKFSSGNVRSNKSPL
jgi:hypothetical protein